MGTRAFGTGRKLSANEHKWLRGHARLERIPLQPLVKRVEHHEPMQYVMGSTPFAYIDVKCSCPTLIPRTETENWTVSLVESLRQVSRKCLQL